MRAAAALAGRWLTSGGPLCAAIAAVRSAAHPRELLELFVVGPHGNGVALLGRGRAAEIVVNAALPLAHAWATLADRSDVSAKALDLYRRHPKLPENAITREMRAVLAARGVDALVRGARDQQGLLFLYRAMTGHGVLRMPESVPSERP